jgi:hypothetical protein
MSSHDDVRLDLDLEARLRRIAADPPPLPETVDAMAWDVVRRRRRWRFVPVGVRRRSSRIGASVGVVVTVAIAVVIAGIIVPAIGPRPVASWTLRPDAGRGEWTALQWHEITTTAGGIANELYGGGWTRNMNLVVRWRDGFASIGADYGVWLSSDGITWHRSPGSPSHGGLYLAGADGALLAGGEMPGGTTGVWLTVDGATWTLVAPPAGVTWASPWSVASGAQGLVLARSTDRGGLPEPLTGIYFTSDAKTWQKATLPADLVAAYQVNVAAFFGGFVAVGEVLDPNGSSGYSTDGGPTTYYSYRSWVSPDGLHWSQYAPPVQQTGFSSNVPPWNGVEFGRLGGSDGHIHSADGLRWTADEGLPGLDTPLEVVGDGTRIVIAADSGRRFFVSEGDGHWTELRQGGDVANLPAGGQLMVLPHGVLWIGGGRVYFGQGLAGVDPQGSIGPPVTPTPNPSAGPTSTPAVEGTTTAMPTPAHRPTDLKTTGSDDFRGPAPSGSNEASSS